MNIGESVWYILSTKNKKNKGLWFGCQQTFLVFVFWMYMKEGRRGVRVP